MSYAVLWSTNGGQACPGKLELRRGRLLFEGSAASGAEASELPLDEIAEARVGRSSAERLGGRPVLVLERTERDAVRITPIGGVGVLHELLELVNRNREDAGTGRGTLTCVQSPRSGGGVAIQTEGDREEEDRDAGAPGK